MCELDYMIEYNCVGYIHELLVLCLCLVSAWVPVILYAVYRLVGNALRLATKLVRRWF